MCVAPTSLCPAPGSGGGSWHARLPAGTPAAAGPRRLGSDHDPWHDLPLQVRCSSVGLGLESPDPALHGKGRAGPTAVGQALRPDRRGAWGGPFCEIPTGLHFFIWLHTLSCGDPSAVPAVPWFPGGLDLGSATGLNSDPGRDLK